MQTTEQVIKKMTHADAKILAHYAAGESIREITVATSNSDVRYVEMVIRTLANDNRNLAKNLSAEWQRQAKAQPSPAAGPPQAKAASPAVDLIADMLTEAAETGEPKLVRAADKISDLVEELEARMATHRSQVALRDEAAQLEARLVAIRAQMQPGTTNSASKADSKAVRAWAQDNAVDCPKFGRVPAQVIEAYQQATRTSQPAPIRK